MTRHAAAILLVAAASGGASGCAGEDEVVVSVPVPAPVASPDDPTDWRAVADLIEAECTVCHHDGGAAPFPLQTHEQAVPWALAIGSSATSRSMPPWPASPGDVPYRFDRSLAAEEIDLLNAWAEAGAPPWSLGGEDPRDLVADRTAEMTRVDQVLTMPEGYAPGSLTPDSPDDLRCFLVVPDDPVEGFMVEGVIVPGNPAVVHHANFVMLPDSELEAFTDFEAADPLPGWDCEGFRPGTQGTLGTFLPGQTPLRMPPNTGLAIEPDSIYVMVVHYYEPLYKAPFDYPDRSSAHLMLEPAVEHIAEYVTLKQRAWSNGVLIPEGETHAVNTGDWDWDALQARFEQLDTSEGVWLHSVLLHMHEAGFAGKLELIRSDGEVIDLLDIPQWDFDWQIDYEFAEPIRIGEGDRLTVTCEHATDGSYELRWGDGTDQEMCNARYLFTEPGVGH